MLAEAVDEHTQTFEKFVAAVTQWQQPRPGPGQGGPPPVGPGEGLGAVRWTLPGEVGQGEGFPGMEGDTDQQWLLVSG